MSGVIHDIDSLKLASVYTFPQKCLNKIRLWPCQLTQRLLATYANCSQLLTESKEMPVPVSCHQLELQLVRAAFPVEAAVDTHRNNTTSQVRPCYLGTVHTVYSIVKCVSPQLCLCIRQFRQHDFKIKALSILIS